MAETCWKCKRNHPGEAGYVSFKHKRISVKTFKVGSMCKSCTVKAWKENFRKCQSVVTIEAGVPKVDWLKYLEFERKMDIGDAIGLILVDIGILSLCAAGCWDIVTHRLGLSPSALGTCVFFVKKEDAIEYAQLNYSNTQYSWEIRHVDEIIKKSEII